MYFRSSFLFAVALVSLLAVDAAPAPELSHRAASHADSQYGKSSRSVSVDKFDEYWSDVEAENGAQLLSIPKHSISTPLCDIVTTNARALMLATDRLSLDYIRLCAKAFLANMRKSSSMERIWTQAAEVLDTSESALKEALSLVNGAIKSNPTHYGLKLKFTRTQIKGRIAAVDALRAIQGKIPGLVTDIVRFALPGWVSSAASMVKSVAETAAFPSWAEDGPTMLPTVTPSSSHHSSPSSAEAKKVFEELDGFRQQSARNVRELNENTEQCADA